MAASIETLAIISRPPGSDKALNWKIEKVTLKAPGDGELLVRVIATGICHTDISMGLATQAPRVLGHEGSGVVVSIGNGVTVAKPGDLVLMSFAYCASCKVCEGGHPAYCKQMGVLNGYKGQGDFTDEDETGLQGKFFGQSSFAHLTTVMQTSVVNVSHLLQDEEELKIYSPLGCGFQTGASTVVNLCKAAPSDTVVVLGLGGVGMAAIMAARVVGCMKIIGVDRIASRLKLAAELGATDVIDGSEPGLDLKVKIEELTQGHGPSLTLDTTSNPDLLKTAFEFTGQMGKLVMVGMPSFTATFEVHLIKMLTTGKILMASVEGDANPAEFLPLMVQWHREGRFPIEKMIKYYKVDEFNEALAGMKSGEVIKPVLVF